MYPAYLIAWPAWGFAVTVTKEGLPPYQGWEFKQKAGSLLETEDKMSVDNISKIKDGYESTAVKSKTGSAKNPGNAHQSKAEDAAAVYEKSSDTESNKVYQRDNATIERMMQEAERRSQSLRSLVEKMLLKQGETFSDSTDIYALLREGKIQADPETRAQAQKDIAEDGYWGVKQTSDRLLSFAKALAGGDPSKADSMIEAVKKGFEEATKTWGGELPGICNDTMKESIRKLEEWRDSVNKEVSACGTV